MAGLGSRATLDIADSILQEVFGSADVNFAWFGRRHPQKFVVVQNGRIWLNEIAGLSGGQSTLLAMFGRLAAYADEANSDPASVEGICIIDEIDAHMHIDLQHRAIPALIKMFPKVQFILSAHSPFFTLGMTKRFGESGFEIIELPSGVQISAESFSEFEQSLAIMTSTSAFSAHLRKLGHQKGLPLVLVEGETDPIFIRATAKALGASDILDKIELHWIGAKDTNGQGYMTGKDAMKQARHFLSANPSLLDRHILLFGDNDTPQIDTVIGQLHVRTMPAGTHNSFVSAGIESYLPDGAFGEEFYETKETKKPNGETVTIKKLKKMALCNSLTSEPLAENFAGFTEVVEIIKSFIQATGA